MTDPDRTPNSLVLAYACALLEAVQCDAGCSGSGKPCGAECSCDENARHLVDWWIGCIAAEAMKGSNQ